MKILYEKLMKQMSLLLTYSIYVQFLMLIMSILHAEYLKL